MWGFFEDLFFSDIYMSKIRIRMLDDHNLPPEIDISTQRWHVHVRMCQNRALSHNTSAYAYLFHTNGQYIITHTYFLQYKGTWFS